MEKSSLPSTQINWKNINKDELNHILSDEEGFDMVTHLRGDDAASVADFLDRCLDSSDISDALRTGYTAVLSTLCGNSVVFPSSHVITEDLVKISDVPKLGYSGIWKGKYKGETVAVKIFEGFMRDKLSEMNERLCKQMVIWKRISHPNILAFLGASVRDSQNQLWLVLPWMEDEKLDGFVKMKPGIDRFPLFGDITDGLSYLHSRDIIHGNLRGDNILITHDHRACLAVCGEARIASRIPGYSIDPIGYAGITKWLAPEQLSPEEYGLNSRIASKEADIYALGMVIYEIITGGEPFPEFQPEIAIANILAGIRPERPTRSIATEFVDTIWPIAETCWRELRHERPTISEVLGRLNQITAPVDASSPSPYVAPSMEETSSPFENSRLVPHDVTGDIVLLSPQSIIAVNQLEEERRFDVDTPIVIQNDDSNCEFLHPNSNSDTPPSVPTEWKWKSVNEANLNSLVEMREGFKMLTGLKGDDAVIVADIIDGILDSRNISDKRRNRYTAILRKLCGNCGIFPTSHTLTAGLEKVGESPKAGGGFAEVWEGRYKGRPVAIKALRAYQNDILRVTKLFCQEAVVWKRLSHPNVLPFLGVATSPFPFCIASPWMAHGNLNEYLASHPQANRYFLLRDIVNGLLYLHSLGTVHGDLKGPNILISDSYRACLADFGLTTIDLDTIHIYSTTPKNIGTMQWMAPELLDPEKYGLDKSVPSRESDIYALGIVIYEIITGDVPYKEFSNQHHLALKVLNGARPKRPREPDPLNFANDVWPIAEECWLEQRNKRLTLSRILARLSFAQAG